MIKPISILTNHMLIEMGWVSQLICVKNNELEVIGSNSDKREQTNY